MDLSEKCTTLVEQGSDVLGKLFHCRNNLSGQNKPEYLTSGDLSKVRSKIAKYYPNVVDFSKVPGGEIFIAQVTEINQKMIVYRDIFVETLNFTESAFTCLLDSPKYVLDFNMERSKFFVVMYMDLLTIFMKVLWMFGSIEEYKAIFSVADVAYQQCNPEKANKLASESARLAKLLKSCENVHIHFLTIFAELYPTLRLILLQLKPSIVLAEDLIQAKEKGVFVPSDISNAFKASNDPVSNQYSNNRYLELQSVENYREFALLAFLACPYLFYDPECLDIFRVVSSRKLFTPLYRDLVISFHLEFHLLSQFFPEHENSGFTLTKAIELPPAPPCCPVPVKSMKFKPLLKELSKMAVQESGLLGFQRRLLLREELRKMNQLLKGTPGLVAPRLSQILGLCALCRDELLESFRHMKTLRQNTTFWPLRKDSKKYFVEKNFPYQDVILLWGELMTMVHFLRRSDIQSLVVEYYQEYFLTLDKQNLINNLVECRRTHPSMASNFDSLESLMEGPPSELLIFLSKFGNESRRIMMWLSSSDMGQVLRNSSSLQCLTLRLQIMHDRTIVYADPVQLLKTISRVADVWEAAWFKEEVMALFQASMKSPTDHAACLFAPLKSLCYFAQLSLPEKRPMDQNMVEILIDQLIQIWENYFFQSVFPSFWDTFVGLENQTNVYHAMKRLEASVDIKRQSVKNANNSNDPDSSEKKPKLPLLPGFESDLVSKDSLDMLLKLRENLYRILKSVKFTGVLQFESASAAATASGISSSPSLVSHDLPKRFLDRLEDYFMRQRFHVAREIRLAFHKMVLISAPSTANSGFSALHAVKPSSLRLKMSTLLRCVLWVGQRLGKTGQLPFVSSLKRACLRTSGDFDLLPPPGQCPSTIASNGTATATATATTTANTTTSTSPRDATTAMSTTATAVEDKEMEGENSAISPDESSSDKRGKVGEEWKAFFSDILQFCLPSGIRFPEAVTEVSPDISSKVTNSNPNKSEIDNNGSATTMFSNIKEIKHASIFKSTSSLTWKAPHQGGSSSTSFSTSSSSSTASPSEVVYVPSQKSFCCVHAPNNSSFLGLASTKRPSYVPRQGHEKFHAFNPASLFLETILSPSECADWAELMGLQSWRVIEESLMTYLSEKLETIRDFLLHFKEELAEFMKNPKKWESSYAAMKDRLNSPLQAMISIGILLVLRQAIHGGFHTAFSRHPSTSHFLHALNLESESLSSVFKGSSVSSSCHSFFMLTQDFLSGCSTSSSSYFHTTFQAHWNQRIQAILMNLENSTSSPSEGVGSSSSTPLFSLLPGLIPFLFMADDWKKSQFLPKYEVFRSNEHCLQFAISTLFSSYFSHTSWAAVSQSLFFQCHAATFSLTSDMSAVHGLKKDATNNATSTNPFESEETTPIIKKSSLLTDTTGAMGSVSVPLFQACSWLSPESSPEELARADCYLHFSWLFRLCSFLFQAMKSHSSFKNFPVEAFYVMMDSWVSCSSHHALVCGEEVPRSLLEREFPSGLFHLSALNVYLGKISPNQDISMPPDRPPVDATSALLIPLGGGGRGGGGGGGGGSRHEGRRDQTQGGGAVSEGEDGEEEEEEEED